MTNPQESFTAVSLAPGTLLHSRRAAVSQNTLLYQLDVLKKTGRYDAFKLEWHSSYSDPPDVWPIPNHLFWDSDIGKWIEGACYFLMSPDDAVGQEVIQEAVDELVAMIFAAQQADGYLNIHYTVVAPGLRFTNLRDMHELYNCGHLIEGALAHDALVAPKSSPFLDTMIRYVDLLCTLFGPEPHQMHGYPGHPEIELALMRLYKRTGSARHLDLASYFVTERGNPTGSLGKHYYLTESERRGEDPHASPSFMGQRNAFWYHQAHLPIVQQTEIRGHSVRAMYLLTAAADLCLVQPKNFNADLLPAVRRLWDDMVQRKMYLTGGIGAISQWEGFGLPHFLPQSTDEGGCYAETCASIGIMMLAERLLQLELDGSVADVMELALYNTVLSGMSADGKKFTYVNQLASSEGKPALKEEWFTCACCPPNVLRCMAMLGGYIYSFKESGKSREMLNGSIDTNGETNGISTTESNDNVDVTINTHLFVSSTGRWKTSSGQDVILTQTSNHPWSGKIEFSLKTASKKVALNIRIPAWAKNNWSISPSPHLQTTNNYLHLPPTYTTRNPSFTLTLPIHARLISPHPLASSAHTLTIARGPIIYCVEDADNKALGVPVHDHFRGLHLDAATCMEGLEEREVEVEDGVEERYVEITLRRGVRWIDLEAVGKDEGVGPGREIAVGGVGGGAKEGLEAGREIEKLVFVPFHYRANRKESKGVSRVGLRRWYG